MSKTYDPLSSNQALQLLWILEKENHVHKLEFTKDELSHIRFCLLEEWASLTSPYKKQLVTIDKLETLSRMSNGLSIFK